MDAYAVQALREYTDEAKMIRRGGQNGSPFWNVNASQFMFVPSFQFPIIPGTKEYVFTAVDSCGKTHTFTAEAPTASLAPIWKELAVGMVELKVEAVHKFNGKTYLAGARTFYKTAPFPGREALPPKACSYEECALKAFRGVFQDPIAQHWLTHGTPKPDFYHNVYPSKTTTAIIWAVLAYAELEPENAEAAHKLATNAADYLLSITYGEDYALEGLPPTYCFKDLIKEIVDEAAPPAAGRSDCVMMIYPAKTGNTYLRLEEATGDRKYFDAALRIGEYYKKNVQPNGSWYLMVEAKTGERKSDNYCSSLAILDLMHDLYLRTGDEAYHQIEKNYFSYIEKSRLESYSWEGQFEDSALSFNYANLSLCDAGDILEYIVANFSDDPDKMKEAEELLRFIEDQFIAWEGFAEWNPFLTPGERWYSPAGMEQYNWYVPIDAHTALSTHCFMSMYKATGNELYREKACALADAITRMQNPETGIIPTHWMTTDCSTVLKNFWVNCHIGTAFRLMDTARMLKEEA